MGGIEQLGIESGRDQELGARCHRGLQLGQLANCPSTHQGGRIIAAKVFDRAGGARQRERDLDRPQARLQSRGRGRHGELEVVEADDPDEARGEQAIDRELDLAQRPTSRRSFAIRPATSPASSRKRSPCRVI